MMGKSQPLLRWMLTAALVSLTACASPRVHRLIRFEYLPKPPSAEIELYKGPPVEKLYETIAVVDSKRYTLLDYNPRAEEGPAKTRHEAASERNEAALRRMLEDLEEAARDLGGDAVHKIRLLSTRTHSFIPDSAVPLPGTITQGFRTKYFRRGEVIRYREAATGSETAPKPGSKAAANKRKS